MSFKPVGVSATYPRYLPHLPTSLCCQGTSRSLMISEISLCRRSTLSLCYYAGKEIVRPSKTSPNLPKNTGLLENVAPTWVWVELELDTCIRGVEHETAKQTTLITYKRSLTQPEGLLLLFFFFLPTLFLPSFEAGPPLDCLEMMPQCLSWRSLQIIILITSY